jgi:hypothetical protein
MATRAAVYAKFGITAEAAQLFETDLGTILLAYEGGQRDWHLTADPESAAAFYEKMNRKTLGQLLDALRKCMSLADDVEATFNLALAARNRLNHGFFESHNFGIHSEEGRDAMLADLDEMHTQLSEAWKIANEESTVWVARLYLQRKEQHD